MSLHKVFCQPVVEHIIGEGEKPSGFLLFEDVESRNAYFRGINQQYDVDHEKARIEGHYLSNGYTYLKPNGEPHWGLVDDDIFYKIDAVENGKRIHHFPDLKPPIRVN